MSFTGNLVFQEDVGDYSICLFFDRAYTWRGYTNKGSHFLVYGSNRHDNWLAGIQQKFSFENDTDMVIVFGEMIKYLKEKFGNEIDTLFLLKQLDKVIKENRR